MTKDWKAFWGQVHLWQPPGWQTLVVLAVVSMAACVVTVIVLGVLTYYQTGEPPWDVTRRPSAGERLCMYIVGTVALVAASSMLGLLVALVPTVVTAITAGVAPATVLRQLGDTTRRGRGGNEQGASPARTRG